MSKSCQPSHIKIVSVFFFTAHCFLLAVFNHLCQFLFRDARVLHGVTRVPMTELALHGGHVAGLFYDVPPHRMPRTVRRLPCYSCQCRHFIPDLPDLVDDVDSQPTRAVRHRGRR
jgi:hypothetical protein